MQCFGLLFLNILFLIIYCCRFFLLSLSQAIKHIAVTQTLIKRRRITSLEACLGSADGLHGGLWLCQRGANREPRPTDGGEHGSDPRTMACSWFWLVCHQPQGRGRYTLSDQDFKVGMYELHYKWETRWGLAFWCSCNDFKDTCRDPRLCTNTFWPHVQTLDLHNTRKSDPRT